MRAKSRRCLHRRAYSNKVPNFAIQMDGLAKLKPFGISIHGAVDGYSRRVLWLRACNSNKNPQYVARFYLDHVKGINGVPMIVSADRGTENSIARDIQYGLRWNHNDPFKESQVSFTDLPTETPRLRFWRGLREMVGNTWVYYFKDLTDYGKMDTSDMIHLECSRFCFLHLIDTELDGVARHWNEYRIRKKQECSSARWEARCFVLG